MATAAFFDNSGGSSSSSASSMLESVELRSRNSKNHATATDPWRHESPNGGSGNGRVQLMEHKVNNGETIMQIALLYSVPVSEIKRVNNIVSDQEIHALPIVKVPISRQFLLRRQLMESNGGGCEGQIISLDNDEPQQLQQSTSTSITNGTIHHSTMAGIIGSQQQGKNSDKLPLLDYQDQNLHGSAESLLSDNGTGGTRTRLAIEGILDEADRTVAAVRQNLPSSPGLEGGAFHFVDAGAPDHSSNIWLIVIVVVIMFVLIPLGITFLEETNEMEEHNQQNLHHNGLMEEHDG